VHHRLEVHSTPPPTIQACYDVSHYQQASCYIQPYLQPSSVTSKCHQLEYMIPFCRTDICSRSYFMSTIRLWNQIPRTRRSHQPYIGHFQGKDCHPGVFSTPQHVYNHL